LSFLISLAYGVVNPLFEAPDEHYHYFTAQYVADNWALPSLPPTGDDYDKFMSQEAAQPPLYYVLSALLIAPIDTSSARDDVWFNPRVQLGDASALSNINAFVHTPQEDFPWQGYVLAAQVLRIFSAIMGVGTLIFIYKSGRLLWADQPNIAWLATALVAFLPQFNFHHGAITNDTLIILLCSAGIYQLIYLWQTNTTTPKRLAWLGVTVGLAMLTKNAGIVLFGYTLIFLFILDWRFWILESTFQSKIQNLKSKILPFLLPAFLLSGWLYIRNTILYGDPTATNQFIRIAGGDRGYTVLQVLDETWRAWISLFGVFGWFNVRAPLWVYGVWGGMVLLSIIGFTFYVLRFRQKPNMLMLLLALFPFLIYAGIATFMLRTPAAQGRLLFPAILPMALGLAYGLSRWQKRWIYWLMPSLALATTLFTLFWTIPRVYTPLSAPDLTLAEAETVLAKMDDHINLVGARIDQVAAQPGEVVVFSLFWQTENRLPPTARDIEEVIVLLGRNGEALAIGDNSNYQGYQGQGLNPPLLWSVGTVVPDVVKIELPEQMVVPTQVIVNVSLLGEDVNVNAGTFKVVPPEFPPFSEVVLAQLGDHIQLVSATLDQTTAQSGDMVSVSVRWQATDQVGQDWTTFVHVGDPNQPPLITGDSPPLGGDYPTHFWAEGEVMDDEYALFVGAEMPAGRYPVWIGMYDPETFVRLPLTINGAPQANNALQIGWLEILP
jgi:hypothetical protein